jgi:hypothetical protein
MRSIEMTLAARGRKSTAGQPDLPTMQKTPRPAHDATGRPEIPSSGFQTLLRVLPYLWPEGLPWVKRRVVLAMVFLVLAKAVSILTPYLYKLAVDALDAQTANDPAITLLLGAVGLTVAYGLARLGAVVFGELRDAVFVRVGQRALRQLALETFTHIHRCRCAITSPARPAA